MTVAAFVFAWLAAQGVPQPQTDAVMRYIHIESRFDPDPPDNGTGHCMLQWVGARWHRLRDWARSQGCPSLETQLQFALAELSKPEFSCFWQAPPAYAFATLRRTFGAGGSC